MDNELKARMDVWRHAYEQDDNAIVRALVTYAWNYAVYLMFVKIVEHAPNGDDGRKCINAPIFELLRSSYWAGTVLAVRRLIDNQPLAGSRGVCSLTALLRDIESLRDRLDRRAFVEIAGYDYDEDDAEGRNEQFDFLSGTNAGDRDPSDLIRPEIFTGLRERLDALRDKAEHANVYLAHAATEASRQGRVLPYWGIAEAKEALKLLTETAELIGRWFLASSVGTLLPTPQQDQFEHLDRALATPDAIDAMHQLWDEFSDETATWHHLEDTAL